MARLARLERRPHPRAPINDAIHSTGNYAIWLVVISLAVTPARRLFMAPKLINMRRTLGVAAFCYAVLHLALYIVQEKFDLAKVASEIALRVYLTIGFVALIGLIALAATSTDGMIRRLGGERWNRLHKLVYPIALLGIIHFLMQTKLDISESVMVAGFLFWLLGYRLMHRFVGNVTYVWQIALAFVAAALTAVAEAGLVRRDHRRDVVARVLGQSRLGHGVPPGALGADRGLGVTLASLPVVAAASARAKARKASARAPSAPSRSSPAADAAPR